MPYETPAVYVPDFILPHAVYVEAKGYLTAQDRKKLLSVKRAHPELDLRLLFQRAANKLGKGPKSYTYADWATKHGFPWAEGQIPEAWILG